MKTKELLSKLEAVKTAVATSGSDETAKSFLISDKHLYAYSERCFCSVPLDTDLDLQVNAKVLFEFVKKLKGEDVELLNEDGSLRVKSGRNRVLIPAEEKVKIPSNLVDIGEEFELPHSFGENVVNAGFSVGNDPTRPYLNIVKVVEDQIYSTDNHKITRIEMDHDISDVLNIPQYAIKNIGIINPTHYSISGGWLVFENVGSEVVFCCRTVDAEKFPNLDGIFGRTMEWNNIEFPDGMNDSIERAIVFAKHAQKNQQTVRVKSDGDNITVIAKSPVGEYSDEMPFEGCTFDFVTNAKSLLDLLKRRPSVAISGNIMKLENGTETHLISLGR